MSKFVFAVTMLFVIQFCVTAITFKFTFQEVNNNLQLKIQEQTVKVHVCRFHVTQFNCINIKVETLRQKIVDTENRMKEELEKKEREHRNQIASLKQTNKESTRHIADLQQSNTRLTEESTKADRRLIRLEKDKKDLQTEKRSLEEKFLTLDEKYRTLEKKMNSSWCSIM